MSCLKDEIIFGIIKSLGQSAKEAQTTREPVLINSSLKVKVYLIS